MNDVIVNFVCGIAIKLSNNCFGIFSEMNGNKECLEIYVMEPITTIS